MKMGKFWPTLKILIFVFLIGFILIWPVYQYHVWHYPAEKQLSDSQIYLAGAVEPVKQTLLWMADKPVLRAYSLYFTGLTMASIRVVGGNTTYFLGEVSNIAWKNYFPIVYLMKVPLAFHLLTLLVLIYLLFSIRCGRNFIQRTKTWLTSHLPEFAMFTFICLYWLASITGNLNIGIRHLLPVFPFTILLVSGLTAKLLKEPYLKLKYLVLSILILWQACSVFSVYPYFLTYFNEAVGGPANGYKYVADSNLDWGQDLKRLNYWLEENKVDKIYLDYFGGGDPQSTLGNKYAPWWGERNPEEFLKGNYLAVSATFLQGGRGKPIVDIPQAVEYYLWLNNYQPLTTIGHSIFIYYID